MRPSNKFSTTQQVYIMVYEHIKTNIINMRKCIHNIKKSSHANRSDQTASSLIARKLALNSDTLSVEAHERSDLEGHFCDGNLLGPA